MIAGQVIGSAMIAGSVVVAYAGTRWDGYIYRAKTCRLSIFRAALWMVSMLTAIGLLVCFGFHLLAEGMDPVYRFLLLMGTWIAASSAAWHGSQASSWRNGVCEDAP